MVSDVFFPCRDRFGSYLVSNVQILVVFFFNFILMINFWYKAREPLKVVDYNQNSNAE